MDAQKKGRLKLTRRIGESILIGDDVEVTIKAVSGAYVTIVTRAPSDIRIVRKEISSPIRLTDAGPHAEPLISS